MPTYKYGNHRIAGGCPFSWKIEECLPSFLISASASCYCAIIIPRIIFEISRRFHRIAFYLGGIMKTFLLFLTIFALTGCSTYLSYKPLPLVVAEPRSVRGCRFVGAYPGPYGYRFWGPPPVLGDFKYQSASKAKEAGATHIYWREDIRGYYGQTRVTGFAFDCTGVPMPKYFEDQVPY